jgi:Abortive infection C-terminus
MLTLFYGSGSTGFTVGGIAMEETEWRKLRGSASRVLAVRGMQEAAELLMRYPFQIHDGENDFGDEFSVLHAEVDLPAYVEIEEIHRGAGGRQLFAAMANTFTELGRYIRFVAVDLSLDDAPDPVSSPKPAFTTDVVERALRDAEQLLSGSGPISAVDRVHTALHGYLRELCSRLNATTQSTSTLEIGALFKALRTTSIFNQSEHSEHAERLAQGLATVIDAFNPIRNRGSLAHPNKVLLTEAEAMLAINAGRSILHYVNASISQGKEQ